ncbi:CehA/McbA family metallohydrolase [Streptomyces sp. NPDC051921]|uniref:CehA/McbA family metallohydrolase n=1 Tax=Streptomyces sp. NPDC051921 TaxID=3155806 RepID=UPI0034456F0E
MTDAMNHATRRALLATGAATALTLGTVSFAEAAEGPGGPAAGPGGPEGRGGAAGTGDLVRSVSGTLPPGSPDFVYLPVELPKGVRELHVAYAYDRPAVPAGTQGNALDIGLFDQRGTALGGRGFRGWSGGARKEFFVRADEATPGYVAGPLRAGTWYVALSPYTIAPQGLAYTVTVTLRLGAPAPAVPPVYPPERARGRGRAWYRGDCHLHTVHSDGRRTPAEVAALARAAGLDFLAGTEHNTHAGHGAWADSAGDDLLVLLGEEVTTRTGHVLALGTDPGTFVDWRYRARENRFGRFAREIRRAGGLVVPAHPQATCIGCAWKFGFGDADAVEVWNGPYTPDDEVSLAGWDGALARGRWTPAMGNSDAHRDPDLVGTPQTVVLADELSRGAILDGLRAGRSYVAESSSVSVEFTLTDAHGRTTGLGERLTVPPDEPVTARLRVTGAPQGGTVRLVTDQGVLFTAPATGTAEWTTSAARSAYVRAEVRHPVTAPPLPGALSAFTNPVFLQAR